MKLLQAVLVTALAIGLAGCVLSGKPKTTPPATPQPTPAPPPEPVSIPQTQVNLPTFQAVDPAALRTAPMEEPAPPVETKQAEPAPRQQHPAAPATPPPVPAKPPEQVQPPPQPEATRLPIQEILPDEERKRLHDMWQQHLNSARHLVGAAQNRHLTQKERRAVMDINQIVKQSEQAETNGDWRLANSLAERADTLAKDLQGGK